ncbi:hypothetical protein IGK44_002536 [Enterococcus sp. DIV1248a]|nr:hypothetical protein OI9_05102 [Enterococcus faecium EnGen0001]ELB63144.1 hypothetical protein OKY_04751 [Enterococcus faecium EnGen0048]EOG39134.1 hypothetical protein SMS_00727 [Enterococcus faecium EnGen0184]EOM66371.1 hypothetical protein SKE_02091 [Enterococcus faecium EnGen0165]OTO43645.1 hypothetical protein A5831_002438 [Enterococcus faecium]
MNKIIPLLLFLFVGEILMRLSAAVHVNYSPLS